MKIAIYTICRNEEHNIEKFMNSTEGVPVYILDTGSSDKSVELLKQYSNVVVKEGIIYPWRFDTARNYSLNMVPDDVDICVSIDMDEVLEPGWSNILRREWNGNLGSYQYIAEWSDHEKTIPSVVGPRTKIHSRHDYTWTKPVHEALVPKPGVEKKHCDISFTVKHYRSQKFRDYIPLLNMILEVNPNDAVTRMQRAAEYFILGEYGDALKDYKIYLILTHDLDDAFHRHRKSLICTAIAQCYYQLQDPDNTMRYYLKALAEYPESREPWIRLAHIFDAAHNPAMAYGFGVQGYQIKNRNAQDVADMSLWNENIEDLISRNYYKMQDILEKNHAYSD